MDRGEKVDQQVNYTVGIIEILKQCVPELTAMVRIYVNMSTAFSFIP